MWKTRPPPGRIEPKLRPFIGTCKILLASNVVTALIIGYALSLKVFHAGTFGFGLYFLFITTDFVVQFSSALYNRRRVSVIAKKAMAREQRLIEAGVTPKTPRIIMTAVGYREDGEAWMSCLRTLDTQRMLPQAIICCVDGNEAPDLEMAKQFEQAYADRDHRVVHLEKTMAQVYKEAFEISEKSLRRKPHTRWQKFKRWFTSIEYPEEQASHVYARKVLGHYVRDLHEKVDLTQCYRTLYTQPHGDKRTAMFTAFVFSLFLGAEAVFATDSDTLLEPNALQEMWMLLESDPNYGAVTADVHIENWKDSFISLQSRLRYWMAFNIERACQSTFRCVTCISGPMALYRAYDLDSILGMWLCQTFMGVHTTFGDDRHLTNCLLGKGLKTAYTHRTACHSESPATFVRWIRQQTRWSKSFYREAIWFPRAFAYHHIWLGVETLKQGLYPFILLATVFNILYGPTPWLRLVTWAATMFGTAAFKGLLACLISRDWRMLLFPGYPLLYFFGLLPSKVLALSTMGKTNWGTSARSSAERRRGESFGQKSWSVGHLVIFYLILMTGLAHFLVHITGIVWLWFVPFAISAPAIMLYWDELPFKHWMIAYKERRAERKKTPGNRASETLFGNDSASLFFPPGIVTSDSASDATLIGGGMVKSQPGIHRDFSGSTLNVPSSFNSAHVPLKPKQPHTISRASSVGNFNDRQAWIETPPPPALSGPRYSGGKLAPYGSSEKNEKRKSTVDILESGQLWPSLPPPVVSAKGAWVWQPGSQVGHGAPDSSWIGTPGTPGSEVPPYPASGAGDHGDPFVDGPHPGSGHGHRGEAGRQQMWGGHTPKDGFFGHGAGDAYGRSPKLAPHGPFLGPQSAYHNHGQPHSSVLGAQRQSRGSSSNYPYGGLSTLSSNVPSVRNSSAGSTSSGHNSAVGMLPYPPPRHGADLMGDGRQPLLLDVTQYNDSEAPSPITSPRTLAMDASPTSSQFHLPAPYRTQYGGASTTGDSVTSSLLTKYEDPFQNNVATHKGYKAVNTGGNTSGEDDIMGQRYLSADALDASRESVIFYPRFKYGAHDSRCSDTSAIDAHWAKGSRMTTYGGLIDDYEEAGAR